MRHPLHPALVHFLVACWSLAVAADFASLHYGQAAWQWSAGLLAVGCVMALAAMLAGLMELSRVPEGAAMRDAYLHMGAMLLALTLFTTRLLLRLDNLQPMAPRTPFRCCLTRAASLPSPWAAGMAAVWSTDTASGAADRGRNPCGGGTGRTGRRLVDGSAYPLCG